MGHAVHYCAGDLGTLDGTLIPELYHHREDGQRLYNNTFIGHVNRPLIFSSSFKYILAKNNIFALSGAAMNPAIFSLNSANNASDNATDLPAANNYRGVTFTFEDAPADVYNLVAADTGAKELGLDLSADALLPVTEDIQQVARTTPYDIGAYEFSAAVVEETLVEMTYISDYFVRTDPTDVGPPATDTSSRTPTVANHVAKWTSFDNGDNTATVTCFTTQAERDAMAADPTIQVAP